MRIAFDVSGTIEGPRKPQVLHLLRLLKAQGHEIFVWSNLYSYVVNALKNNELESIATGMSKQTQGDLEFDSAQYMDIAIDDDPSQTWLAAKQFIWVRDLPRSSEEIEILSKQIGGVK